MTRLEKIEHLVELGKYELAEKAINEVLKKDPDDFSAHYLLALNYQKWGRIKSALKEAKETLRLDPNSFEAHIILAEILADGIDLREAEKEFKNAIELNPSSSYSFASYAQFLVLNGRKKEAEKYARKSLAIDPNDDVALNAIGLLRKKTESKKALETRIRQSPTDHVALNNMGIIELESGNYDKAVECFRTALRVNPEYSVTRDNLILAIKARNVFYRPFYIWSTLAQKPKIGGLIRTAPSLLLVATIFTSVIFKLTFLVSIALLLFFGFIFYTWTIDRLFALLIEKKIIKVD